MRQHPASPAGEARRLDEIVQHLLGPGSDEDRHHFLGDCLDQTDPARLLDRLKLEEERYLNVEPGLALRFAEDLLWAAERAGQPEHQALGLLAKGETLRILGRHHEAVRLFDEASRVFASQSDDVGKARSRIGWLWTMHLLGRADEALPVGIQALDVLVDRQEWLRAGNAAIYVAWVYSELARYDEALAFYGRAQSFYEHLGESTEIQVGWIKAHLAWILNHRGDFRAALALHQEARAIFVRHEQRVLVLEEEGFIAYAYAGQGRYSEALRLYSDVLAAHEAMGVEPEVGLVALDLAACYLELNRYPDALALGEEAAERFTRCQAPIEVAKAQLLCAVARARLGDTETAQALLDAVIQAFTDAGFGRQLGLATLLRATLFLRDGQWEASLQTAARAQAIFAERELAVDRGRSELLRARAFLALGRYEEASGDIDSALAIATDREVPWLAQEGYHLRGNVARQTQTTERAIAEYDRSIAQIERVQSRLPSELRTNLLEDKLQVYHDAIECSLELGDAEQALAYLERAKSRALVDYLTGNPEVRTRARTPASQELVDQLARLREEHSWLYNRIFGYGLAQRPDDEPDDAEHRRLTVELREREKRIARITERLALDGAPELGRPAWPTPDARPLPIALDETTALVEYYFGNDGGMAFVRTCEGLAVVPLAIGPEAVQRRLSRLQLNFEATAQALARGSAIDGLAGNARSILHELHQQLIAPIAPLLVRRENLVIVPYGPTHGVPFHALYGGTTYLIETHEVSLWPSSTLRRLASQRLSPTRGRNALVVGYSDSGRLPKIIEEAQAIAALLPGECYLEAAATRAAVIGAAPRFGVIHLATHGEARLDNPAFAFVKLADGQLSAADIFNLELDGALITLSACETGRSVVVGGDEAIGLGRGFLYAGASTLVQSLWRVEDGSTARLMQRFYQALSQGYPKGAALRDAQRASLATDGEHPYLWAPFQLIGDCGLL